MPAADRDTVGVALNDPDPLIWNAEAIGQNLWKRGLMALPDRLRAGDQRHRAIGLKADVDILLRRTAGSFDVVSKAQAPKETPRLAVLSPRRKPREIRADQR